ncbi:hypothetical protein [Sessilibacter sp. MAH2]
MKHLALFSLIFLSINAFAGGTTTSTIDFIQINSTGSLQNRAFIKLHTPATNQPACATDNRFTVDLTTDAGKSIFSSVIAAKASDREMFIGGTGGCTEGFENVSYVRFL